MDKYLLAIVLSDTIEKSDAIICLQGDNLNRIRTSAFLFNEGLAPIMVISGGLMKPLSSMKIATIMKSIGIDENKILVEYASKNTREQAINVLKMARSKNWEKIILVASEFHQLRAFLTFLKVAKETKMDIRIYNAPSGGKWFGDTQWGKTRIDLLKEEFAKIKEYTKKGHVATYKQGLEYQKWKG